MSALCKGAKVRRTKSGPLGIVVAGGRKWATVQFPAGCKMRLRIDELEVVRITQMHPAFGAAYDGNKKEAPRDKAY